jgi:hypothetical protein
VAGPISQGQLKPKLLQATLTAGEMAPSLWGRVDIARYQSALRRCRNFLVRPYGGVENRPGLRFAQGWSGISHNRLVPFTFSATTSYVLFFGDGYVRFFYAGAEVAPTAPAYAAGTTYALDAYVTSAGIVYRSLQAGNIGHTPASSPTYWVADAGLQVTVPYTAAQLAKVRYTQSADVLYLVHPDVPPRELRRLSSNSFEVRLFENKEGPFLDLNNDEAIKVAANGTQGTVTISASKNIFTADMVGGLFYLEVKNLGQVKPWVVGDRSVVVGDLRRSDGKTYRAVTVPAGASPIWHETGPLEPLHESGRAWDGPGDARTDGTHIWTVGIEWEFLDTGFGCVKLTTFTDGAHMIGTVTKRLPEQVVGGVGSPANTWNLTGDGSTKTFAIAGAGYGIYAVTIDGVGIPSDPNYVQPDPIGGGFGDHGGRRQL